MTKPFFWGAVLTIALCLPGCEKPKLPQTDFSMGDVVPVGKINYSVVETVWRTELGEAFQIRTPEQRFLLIRVSVTNGGAKDISIPLLTLEGPNGKTYRELQNGQGVDNWIGVLRTISPAQTLQGNVLFDVPLTSYKLRVPDINESGFEGYASVRIPLQLNPDVPVGTTIDPNSLK